MRGLAKTLISSVKAGAGVEFSCYGPMFTWALRHAGWLLSHYRKAGEAGTAYEMVTGRRYQGKLCMFGERVLAKVAAQSGEARFVPAVWLGKTDKGDLNICNTADGIRWSRSVRRLPEPFDAEVLQLAWSRQLVMVQDLVMVNWLWADWHEGSTSTNQNGWGFTSARNFSCCETGGER